MGVRLFYVPLNHRGSTEFLLKEAVRESSWPDYSDILYIAPTPRKLRDSQKRFHRMVKNPYIPPRFFTFRQLSKHIFDQAMPGTVLPRMLTPLLISEISGHTMGYSVMLADLLRELKQHHPSKGLSIIRGELSDIFRRLNVPEDASQKLDRALDVLELYQQRLSDYGYYDEDDVLVYSSIAAKALPGDFSVLIADGFYDMTTAETNLLSELMKKTAKVFISSPASPELPAAAGGHIESLRSLFTLSEEQLSGGPEPDLSYVKYAGVEDELEGVARHIKNLFIAGRMKEEDSVIIAFPKISGHAGPAERVFRRYGIPCTVSAMKPAADRHALRDLLYLLEAVAGDFPRLKFTSFLNSPFFKNLPAALRTQIPSLSLKSGIIKGKASWETLSLTMEDREQAGEVAAGLSFVFSVLDGLIRTREAAELRAFRSEIRKVLSDLGFEAEAEDRELLDKALETLDMIPELSGGEPVPLRRYAEFLRHVLSSPVPRSEEVGIQIMDFREAPGLEPDHLYFCGLKDGEMPSKPPVDHILPDSVRTEYGLINLKKYLAVQKLNFLRLAGASSNLHLSYPSVDGDKVFLQSPYLPWSGEVPEKTFGIFSEEELQVRSGRRLLSDSIREIHLDGKTRARISKKDLSMPLRVTDVDYFRKCPRRFFIERVLDLEASEIAEYKVEARMLGTIIHSIMEELLKEPLEEAETISRHASAVIDRAVGGYAIAPYWKMLIKESFMEILPGIIELESEFRSEGFLPRDLEAKMKEEVLPGIVLKGKIDRLDSDNTSWRIIDYKTGAAAIGSEIIKKGKDLQLPLYAAMLRARGMEVEKAGIYSLGEIGIKWIPTKRDRNTLGDYIEAALKFLEETVKEIREGRFEARPMEEFFCSNCSEAPFCPYIQAKGELL